MSEFDWDNVSRMFTDQLVNYRLEVSFDLSPKADKPRGWSNRKFARRKIQGRRQIAASFGVPEYWVTPSRATSAGRRRIASQMRRVERRA